MTAIMTPFVSDHATRVGQKLFRKKVLPIGEIDYEGKTVRFDIPFLQTLVNSFRAGAFDQVPFQLATDDNKHNNNPELTRGEVAALELADDGLYATVATTEEGAKIITDNPKLGISARIINQYHRADRVVFPAAMQHVLATLDPKIPGLGPWQAVEASNQEGEQVIDLSGLEFREDDDNMADQLSDDELARLREILAGAPLPGSTGSVDPAGDPDPDADGDGDGTDPDELTDEELDELIAAAELMEQEEIAASNDPAQAQALQLVRQQSDQTALELARVQAQLDSQRWEQERAMFVQQYGIPPAILDLARPVLEGDGHVFELSNGEVSDAGAVMRRVLTEIGQQVKLLDLSGEIGTGFAPDVDVQADSERTQLVKAFRGQTGI